MHCGMFSMDSVNVTGIFDHNSCDQNRFEHLNYSDLDFSNYSTIWVHKPMLEICWKSLIVTIIVVCGLLSNFSVIFIVLKKPKFRQQTLHIFIMNLAVADFLAILFIPIVSLIDNIFQNYELGPVMCKMEILIKVMCILAGNFTIIAISFNRFINISCVTNNRHKNHFIMTTSIIVIWVFSILLALPLASMKRLEERQWRDYLEKWCTDYPVQESINYWIFLMSPLIYLPLLVLIVIYSMMIVRINKFIKKLMNRSKEKSTGAELNMSAEHSGPQDDENEEDFDHQPPIAHLYKHRTHLIDHKLTVNRHKVALLKTMFLYCLITLLFWLPLQILVYYRAFRDACWLPDWYKETKFLADLLCSVNSTVNPFIMFWKTFAYHIRLYRENRRARKFQRQFKMENLRLKIGKHPEEEENHFNHHDQPQANTNQMETISTVANIIDYHGDDKKNGFDPQSKTTTTTNNNNNKTNDERICLDKEKIIEVLENFKDKKYDKPVLVVTPTFEHSKTNSSHVWDSQTTRHIAQHILQKHQPQIFQ